MLKLLMKLLFVNAKRVSPNMLLGVLLSVTLATAIACSGSTQVASRVEARQFLATETISISESASVLITQETEDPLSQISEIRVFPSTVVLDPSENVQLRAEAFDARGQMMSDIDFVWAMADPRAGIVDGEGHFVSGAAPGLYEDAISVTVVQNTRSGIKYILGEASVNIVGELLQSKLTEVAIIPENPTVLLGQIYRMRAAGFDQNGLVIPTVSFAWTVENPELGHVNDLGFLTVTGEAGNYPNSITVSGVWDGVSLSETTGVTIMDTSEVEDFFNVQILPQSFHLDSGDRLQLRAVALNGYGEIVKDAQFKWTVEDERAGTISATGSFFAGDLAGVFTESVKVEAASFSGSGIARSEDYASVIVNDQKLQSRLDAVIVRPQSLTVGIGGRSILAARSIDESGRPVENLTVVWEAVQENVGVVDENGAFIASDVPGNYLNGLRVTVRQQLGDEVVTKTQMVDVTITGTLTRVDIQPNLATIAPGRTIHFTTKPTDENGNALIGVITKWSVSDASFGTIDAFGNFTAGDLPGLYENVVSAEVIQQVPQR